MPGRRRARKPKIQAASWDLSIAGCAQLMRQVRARRESLANDCYCQIPTEKCDTVRPWVFSSKNGQQRSQNEFEWSRHIVELRTELSLCESQQTVHNQQLPR